MKQRRVWRYTCEFCRKSGCGKAAMRDHEGRCFKNPNRGCPVCEARWPLEQLAAPMAALAQINAENEAALIEAIGQAVDHCPACTCAAINQGPLPMVEVESNEWDGPVRTQSYRYHVSWDYAKARDEYRREEQADWGVTSL